MLTKLSTLALPVTAFAVLMAMDSASAQVTVDVALPNTSDVMIDATTHSSSLHSHRDFMQTFVASSSFTLDRVYFQANTFSNSGTAQITLRLFTVSNPLAGDEASAVIGSDLASHTYTISAADEALADGTEFQFVEWDLADVELVAGQGYGIRWDDNGSFSMNVRSSAANFYGPGQLFVLGNKDGVIDDFYLALQAKGVLDLGSGLAGSAGVPELTVSGDLCGGTAVDLNVVNGPTSSMGFMIIGLSQLNLPLFGGNLVPSPDMTIMLPTDAAGNVSISATVPNNLPSGTMVFLQYWVVDAGGPLGFAASNAMQMECD
jgi:hypothetical protein